MRWRIEDHEPEIIEQERLDDEYAVYRVRVHLVADEPLPSGGAADEPLPSGGAADEPLPSSGAADLYEQFSGVEIDERLAIEPIRLDTDEDT